jgi:hypothetical protein
MTHIISSAPSCLTQYICRGSITFHAYACYNTMSYRSCPTYGVATTDLVYRGDISTSGAPGTTHSVSHGIHRSILPARAPPSPTPSPITPQEFQEPEEPPPHREFDKRTLTLPGSFPSHASSRAFLILALGEWRRTCHLVTRFRPQQNQQLSSWRFLILFEYTAGAYLSGAAGDAFPSPI